MIWAGISRLMILVKMLAMIFAKKIPEHAGISD
jgi:hypothetical protein